MLNSTHCLPILCDSDEDQEMLDLLDSEPSLNVQSEKRTNDYIGLVDSIYSEELD